ncbi:2-hydroxyhepta-2,4-diene-1,7-dioate isomerase [Bacteroidia bacterium]|nr:2-hydroxyhepta-2,4-diene-1,7-dioate isomerase [Bacteroidia bacterium]
MKIICIGRNYLEHIRELDNTDRLPGAPQFFMKPDTALLRNNDPFYVPSFSRQLDYETELVVRICRVGRSVEERFARRFYTEVGLGIDFTARDLQREVIANGLPWEICKAFDRSAAVSPTFVPLAELGGDIQKLHFEMSLNGQVRQRGDTAMMIFGVDRIISYVSQFVTLKMGDLLFTGTPVGVGPVHPGDHLTATLEGRTLLDFDIR